MYQDFWDCFRRFTNGRCIKTSGIVLGDVSMGDVSILLGLPMGVVSMGDVLMGNEYMYNIFGIALEVKNPSFSRCP